jgi:GH24 family phage-related lysozyme (muramidase)
VHYPLPERAHLNCNGPSEAETSVAKMISDRYLQAIKKFEGFTPRATADYNQISNGYGTKARFSGEIIDRVEAERRFRAEIEDAEHLVEKFAPGLDEGTKAALTSLTYNSGTKWMQSGLGASIKSGNIEAASAIITEYSRAGGQVLPGLQNRRREEALWMIGSPATQNELKPAVPMPIASVEPQAIGGQTEPGEGGGLELSIQPTQQVGMSPSIGSLQNVLLSQKARAIERLIYAGLSSLHSTEKDSNAV